MVRQVITTAIDMQAQQIAMIGAGTAGLAAALILARQGHYITMIEQVQALSPVGAGLLLQPAGLAVFAHLGVLAQASTLGAHVTGLEGQLADGRLLVDSHYAEAGQGLSGLGMHRASLCQVLLDALLDAQIAAQITWRMGVTVDRVDDRGSETRLFGHDAAGPIDASFDLVIVANGARSQLRPAAWVALDRPYPWGAMWTIVPECQALDPQILHQFYDGPSIMMGILPTGARPDAVTQRLSSVFWSLPTAQMASWMQSEHARADWLAQVHSRWPLAATWLEQVVTQPEQWLSAQYRDVVMRRFADNRLCVIGDAAHAMSPQLGQGANMALLDAWALGQAMQTGQDWPSVWAKYAALRGSSIYFYQWLSRQLTPLYQSDRQWAGWLRDVGFTWMYRVPYLRREMAMTISGLKTGLWQGLSVEQVARRVDQNNT